MTAHGMRGLHSTLAVDSGITGHAVAAALGHESFEDDDAELRPAGGGRGRAAATGDDGPQGGRTAPPEM